MIMLRIPPKFMAQVPMSWCFIRN